MANIQCRPPLLVKAYQGTTMIAFVDLKSHRLCGEPPNTASPGTRVRLVETCVMAKHWDDCRWYWYVSKHFARRQVVK